MSLEKWAGVEVFDTCPPSPQSFLDLAEGSEGFVATDECLVDGLVVSNRVTKTGKSSKRKKKGLPKYVKHKELYERDYSKLTQRQLLMVLRQQGLETETIKEWDKETKLLLPGTLAEKRTNEKRIVGSRSIRKRKGPLPPLKKHSLPKFTTKPAEVSGVGHSSTTTTESTTELRDTSRVGVSIGLSKAQLYSCTYGELLSLVSKEINRHTCSIQPALRTLEKRLKTIISHPHEYAHLHTPSALAANQTHFNNLIQSQSTCCQQTSRPHLMTPAIQPLNV
ncbi:hypothetical protein NEHOM01_1123 [Nematocida homosporus]|uniref:uncharacterized protein n=1 Tax=Nematocida homosporus TaxID=1912981 RepID=UPI00221EA59F|nr:uncharacterized protein NEHOM01_1123 [Nematocida homosporus]KAI5185873.1 hypothetical protein NEHOM01_1123 [Nematocida homosporus]